MKKEASEPKRKRVDPTETFKEYLKWYYKNEDTLELTNEYIFEYFRAWIAGFGKGYGIGYEHSYETPKSESKRLIELEGSDE